MVTQEDGACRHAAGGILHTPGRVCRSRKYSARMTTRSADLHYRGLMSDNSTDPSLWPRLLGGENWSTIRVVAATLLLQVGGMIVVAIHGTHLRVYAGQDHRNLDGVGIALLLAGPLLLIWRRQAPRLVLGGVLALTGVYYLLGYPHGPAFISLIVAVVAAVMLGRHLFAWASALVVLIAYAGLDHVIGRGSEPTITDYVGVVAWLLVVLIGAEAVQWRRERAAEESRARHEERLRRASEDRARMAQELHDVLGHNISLINVRAGVALHLIDDKPGEARAALEAIKDASKDALAELRTVLGLLRQDGEAAPRSPAPGIGQLENLIADAGASGLAVELHTHGQVQPLPAAADLAAFRIIQEALTNVIRHAQTTSVQVDLTFDEQEIVVRVDDQGSPSLTRQTSEGIGIRGMRERAAALGGSLMAGPKSTGGFLVVARLPYGAPS